MARVRTDNVFGTITDNPLTNVATTMNSAGLADLAAVSSKEAFIILDPNRVSGAPEIVVVTAHTGAATSATIQRGQFGTAARQHAQGTAWVHGPIAGNATTFVTAADDQGDFVSVDGWEAYTPTLVQSAAVTKTVTYAKFMRIGRTIFGQMLLTVTGTGTAANAVKAGLPVAAATADPVVFGPAYVFDSSANLLYTAVATRATSTEVQFLATVNGAATAVLGAASFTAALATGDLINVSFHYEAAS